MSVRKGYQREEVHRVHSRSRGPVWLWLICGILICQTAGTAAWSRYRKQVEASGEALVARLATGTEFQMDAAVLPEKPGESKDVTFTVTNYDGSFVSDTMLQYTAEIKTAENLPLKFQLKHNRTAGVADTDWIPEDTLAGNTASRTGSFLPGEKATHSYTLSIIWPLETGEADCEYADEIDYVQIQIHAKQVSPTS